MSGGRSPVRLRRRVYDPIAGLRQRLVVEAPTVSTDAEGGASYAYSTYATVWGLVVPLRGDIRDEAGAGGAVLTHDVVIRRRIDLTTAMRLRIGARLLAIRAVEDGDPSRRSVVCRCEEVAP